MRLITETVAGPVQEAASRINAMGVVRYVMSISPLKDNTESVVVFKVESYPEYLLYCQKFCRAPMSEKDFFC